MANTETTGSTLHLGVEHHLNVEHHPNRVTARIERRAVDPSPYAVDLDVEAAVENRRVYDFRLPRGHVGRRRRPRIVSI